MFTRFFGLSTLTASVLFFGAAPRIADEPREFESAMYGFEIDPPRFKVDAEAMTANVAYFFAPPTDEFSPNLSIVRHKHTTEFAKYVELSNAQFVTGGMTVKSSKTLSIDGHEAHQWMYAATLGEHQLEFLACAVKQDGFVLLFTYTALSADFERFRPVFEASLGSLKLER